MVVVVVKAIDVLSVIAAVVVVVAVISFGGVGVAFVDGVVFFVDDVPVVVLATFPIHFF